MFHRDTLRLIKKTFKRFLTIFLIVLIGVSFMVGLLSNAPIMRKSVDNYYDEYNFMDVQLYSSYGFSEDDVEAVKDTKNVEDVSATKFVDAYVTQDSSNYITRVQEMDTDVNQYELISGRMPREANEALVVGSSSFGTVFEEDSTIQLHLEDSELSDKLAVTEYTIVGTVRTPQFMASSKETSTLKNLSLNAVILVDNDNFLADYYTSMYVTFENARDYVAFSKPYKEFIEENIKKLEETAEDQQGYRKAEIMAQLEEEIKKAEEEMEKQFADAQKEIDEGYVQLNNGYSQILNGLKEIEANEQALIDGEKEIEANRLKLDQAQQEIDSAKRMIENETGKSYDEAVEQIRTLYNVYIGIEAILDSTDTSGSTTVYEKIRENRSEIRELQTKNAEYEIEKFRLEVQGGSKLEIAALDAKISVNELKIKSLQKENALLNQILVSYSDSPLDTILNVLDRLAGGSVKEAYDGLKQILNGEAELQSGYAQLNAAAQQIEEGKKQIEDAKTQLASGQAEYDKGLAQLEEAQETLDQEYEKARIELEKGRQQLEELPSATWIILDRDSHYSTAMYASNTDQMEKIGQVFPLLFFLVAALVCMTTMKRLVDEERSQIGVFSALGFTKKQIIEKYVIYALAASILASSIGVFIGIPIFPPVIYFCWKLMYDLPDIELMLPISAALIGALSFTILMVIVTFFVARGSLKEMPSQLMRPKAPKNAKKVFLEKIPFIWNRLSFTSKVTARNLIRYKSRFFMTVVGVAGCTSLLVLGFGIKDSIAEVLSIQYEEIMQYDYTITVDDLKKTDQLVETLEDDSNNELVAPFMSYSSKIYLDEEKTISVYVIDEDYDMFVDLRERTSQNPLELDDGVIISEKFAKNNNIKIGDDIKIESSNGLKQKIEVTGICEMYSQHFLFISKDAYEDIFNETVYHNKIAVMPEDGEDFMDSIEDLEGIESITNFSEMMNTLEVMIGALDIIVVVILLAAGSLAFVVLMNLTEVNISERIREIATLKVLGFNDQEVNSYIFKEIFLLTIIGALIGMPLGKIELGYVMNIIDMEMIMFGDSIAPLSYLYGFVITMAFAVIVLIFMRGSLRKVQMVESLKSVE